MGTVVYVALCEQRTVAAVLLLMIQRVAHSAIVVIMV